MLGIYNNFPSNIHETENFNSPVSKKKLQQKITQTLQKLNRQVLTFEEIGNPTIPNSQVIFEFGIADGENFCFLNEEESLRLQELVENEPLHVMDWFCLIRYYRKIDEQTKRPLKFDYYMIRIGFGEKATVDLRVFHERGPRYISPEELVLFIVQKVNGVSVRKMLKQIDQN